MRILELYAGSRSIGKAAEFLGIDVFSTDINPFNGIDWCGDIMSAPFQSWGNFDIIWASPPCQGFSVAAIGKNWNFGCVPKSESARIGLSLLNKTLEIIDFINPKHFFIENPRGMMRKMPQMNTRNMIRHTVTYCQYGDNRMKPTDIWTNCEAWKPRKACSNGDICHQSAPRGSRTGTQALKGDYERSKIPNELCLEILRSCLTNYFVK